MFCKYKDFLGEPNKGIHSYRFMGVAIADVVMTIVGAAILSYYLNQDFLLTLGVLFLLGILLHRLFCVDTTIDRMIRKFFSTKKNVEYFVPNREKH